MLPMMRMQLQPDPDKYFFKVDRYGNIVERNAGRKRRAVEEDEWVYVSALWRLVSISVWLSY